MSNFSTDSDLLAYEPLVFHELAFEGQTQLCVTDAVASGNSITSATGGFAALSTDQIVLIGQAAYSIANILDDNTLQLRTVPTQVSEGLLIVRTLRPQATLVHQHLLRMLGIDSNDAEQPFGEAEIISRQLLRQLENIGTLSLAYHAGKTVTSDNRRFAEKADYYTQLFARRCAAARVLIDTDGDGQADVAHQPGVGNLKRL